MSTVSEGMRRQITDRAGSCSEYCHLPTTDHAPLFNPRTQVWSDHFEWSMQSPVVLSGKTPTGRATIVALQMNHPDVLVVRTLLRRLGVSLEPGTPVRLD
jgi:hypothetical protein